ncbi:hypothetical protein TNCV_2262241 [Trichonephila clavipes]|nr:hypothetical protein TNCV_2262241 [Trichonephila clavipes]
MKGIPYHHYNCGNGGLLYGEDRIKAFTTGSDWIQQSNPFECDTLQNSGDSELVSIPVQMRDIGIATVLQPGLLRWYGLTQIPIVKVLPPYGSRTMR